MPRITKIQLRRGAGLPNAGDFAEGEPGWDSAGGKLYIKNASGSMVEISGGGGNGFGTVSVDGQGDVIAEVPADTLTLIPGSNMSITTNPVSDSVTIAFTGIDPVISGMIF